MKKHKLVNWQGKMKVSPALFEQTENYFIAEQNDIRSLFLQKHDYGLLALTGQNKDVEIQIREHISGNVEVNLFNCNAVTASGERIDFNLTGNETPLSKTFSPEENAGRQGKSTTHWEIILTVDPYERVATGEINPLLTPVRHPDCESLYKLHIVPSDEVNMSAFGSHLITIGRIRKEGERYLADRNYIPPCRTMSAHPELVNYSKHFDRMLYDLRKSSQHIIAKVNNRPDGSELAANIRSISKTIFSYIASIHFRIKNFGTAIPPVLMTEYISMLASHCYTGLIFLPSVEKDELLKYFYEWSNVTPGSFEELMSNTMEIEYEHNNLRSIMVRLEAFINTLCELWEHLSRLEYIGQHKESFVISVTGGNKGDERRGFMISD